MGAVPPRCGGAGMGTGGEEPVEEGEVAGDDGGVERRVGAEGRLVDVSARGEEPIDHVGLVQEDGDHERRRFRLTGRDGERWPAGRSPGDSRGAGGHARPGTCFRWRDQQQLCLQEAAAVEAATVVRVGTSFQ